MSAAASRAIADLPKRRRFYFREEIEPCGIADALHFHCFGVREIVDRFDLRDPAHVDQRIMHAYPEVTHTYYI